MSEHERAWLERPGRPAGASTSARREQSAAGDERGAGSDIDAFGLYDDETRAAIEAWAPPTRPPARGGLAGWRRRSATGAVLGAALLGLGDALEGRRRDERLPIVSEDPGQPHDPDALVEVHLHPSSPAATVAVVRRRLEPG